MLEKFCMKITNYLRSKLKNIDDEKAEVINFGLLVIFGEGPKLIILVLLAWWLDILFLTLVTLIAMSVYRTQAGGFHFNGHISCFVISALIFCGTGLLAQAMTSLPMVLQYYTYALIYIFNFMIIDKYAPADTQNVPIINEEKRKRKKIGSYMAVTLLLIFALICPNQVISNICVLVTFIQSLTMTPLAYKLANCEYGDVSKQNLGLV